MTRAARISMLSGVCALAAGCTCAQLPSGVQWAGLPVDAGQSSDSGLSDAGSNPRDGGADAGTDAGADCAIPVLDPMCTNGWCWAHPLPHGNPINGIWASSSKDAWAVGSNGSITHWDGQSWRGVVSPTSQNLFAVWGSGAGDIWAVGQGNTWLHWDCNNNWRVANWGFDAGDPSASLFGVWGTAQDDVWAVGDNGAFHWDGGRWELSPSSMDAGQPLRGIWGSAADQYWAVGAQGTVLRYDGGLWADATGGSLLPDLNAVWGRGGQVWAAGTGGLYQAGFAGWSQTFNDPHEFLGLWGTGPADLWLAGRGGQLWHMTDAGWSQEVPPQLSQIDLTSGASAWVAGAGGTVAMLDAGVWQVQAGGHNALLDTVWSDGTHVFIGGNADMPGGAFYVLDGGELVDITPGSGVGTVTSIQGSSANDLWAADNLGTVWFYDGGSWTKSLALAGFAGLGIVPINSDANIWVVGSNPGGVGNAWERIAGSWGPYPQSSSAPLNGAFAPAASTTVWAVGPDGGFYVENNAPAGWQPVWSSTTKADLRALWCADPSSGTGICFAVGDNAARFEGSGLGGSPSRQFQPGGPTLRGVWGSNNIDVWTVGDQGLVFYGDAGGSWVDVNVGTINNLNAVWIAPQGTPGWIVGENGTVLHKP